MPLLIYSWKNCVERPVETWDASLEIVKRYVIEIVDDGIVDRAEVRDDNGNVVAFHRS